MNPILLSAIFLAIFCLGLFIEAVIFYWRHDDNACTYKLYAVRDNLVRLNVEGKIDRGDPFFAALYQNISMLLRSSRFISGPDGWPRAHLIGTHLARRPQDAASLERLPPDAPEAMRPIINELSSALEYLTSNHFGVYVQIDANKRERARLQKAQARKLLDQMRNTVCHA